MKGNVSDGVARILLLAQIIKAKAWVNGKETSTNIETINESRYVIISNWSGNDTAIKIIYE